MSQLTDYTKKYAANAIKAGQQFGIRPEFILAQGSVEDAYGTSFAVKNRRNHFGITAAGSPNEYWDGSKFQSSVSKLWFRVYKTDLDSFMDFGRLIAKKYPDAAKAKTADEYSKAISASSYISEKNGDDRSVYQSSIKSRAILMKPILDEIIAEEKKKQSKKQILIIITAVLSLCLVIGIIVAVKKYQKK